jgi:hypothetical protein
VFLSLKLPVAAQRPEFAGEPGRGWVRRRGALPRPSPSPSRSDAMIISGSDRDL